MENKYDELYEFRLADMKDIGRIMEFIREKWSEKHILAHDRAFFDYEFVHGGTVHFILAIDKKTNQIGALQGYIPNSYDKLRLNIYGAITRTSPDVKLPFLGMELRKRLKDILKYESFSGTTLNPRTLRPLIKKFESEKTVGLFEHYYRLNSNGEYKIGKIADRKSIQFKISDRKLQRLSSMEELERQFDLTERYPHLPFKDKEFFERRYYNHPIYQYMVWGIEDVKGKISCIFVAKEVRCNDSVILRCIDLIGDVKEFAYIGHEIQQLMEVNQYEYVDFLLSGMPEQVMKDAGFIMKTKEDTNIIPNYFEPYVCENVDAWYEKTIPDMILFKGDGDQDRPNHRK